MDSRYNSQSSFLFGILVPFTTRPIVRSNSAIRRQGLTRGFPKEHVYCRLRSFRPSSTRTVTKGFISEYSLKYSLPLNAQGRRSQRDRYNVEEAFQPIQLPVLKVIKLEARRFKTNKYSLLLKRRLAGVTSPGYLEEGLRRSHFLTVQASRGTQF